MERLPRITIVTPNFNQMKFLERALRSVLDQEYPNTELIVIDGGSTDGSLDIIRKYEDRIAFWVSEKDNGMYDAINKGFAQSTGEIMCWLNSDDELQPGSLSYVAQLFTNKPEIEWLQGWPTVIDESGEIILQREPIHSRFYFFLWLHLDTFAFIQQESTFWRRSLWVKAGGRLNIRYKVAADFDLWLSFFEKTKLYCTQKRLAAFRKRPGQLSGNRQLYLKEAGDSINDHYKQLAVFEKMIVKTGRSLNVLKHKAGGRIKPLVNSLLSIILGKPEFVKD